MEWTNGDRAVVAVPNTGSVYNNLAKAQVGGQQGGSASIIAKAREEAIALFASIFYRKGGCVKLMKEYQRKYHPDKLNGIKIELKASEHLILTELSQAVNDALGEYRDSLHIKTDKAKAYLLQLSPNFFEEEMARRAEEVARQRELRRQQKIAEFKQQKPALKEILGRLQSALGQVLINGELYSGDQVEIEELYDSGDAALRVVVKFADFTSLGQLEKYAQYFNARGNKDRFSCRIVPRDFELVFNLYDLEKANSSMKDDLPHIQPEKNNQAVALQRFMWEYLAPHRVYAMHKNSLDLALEHAENHLDNLALEPADNCLNVDNDIARGLLSAIKALAEAEDEIREHDKLTESQKQYFSGVVSQKKSSFIGFCLSGDVNDKKSRDAFLKGQLQVIQSVKKIIPVKITKLGIFLGIVTSLLSLGLINLSGKLRTSIWYAGPGPSPRGAKIEGLRQYEEGVRAATAA